MSLKKIITVITLLISFGAFAIPPKPPGLISKPIRGKTSPTINK